MDTEWSSSRLSSGFKYLSLEVKGVNTHSAQDLKRLFPLASDGRATTSGFTSCRERLGKHERP